VTVDRARRRAEARLAARRRRRRRRIGAGLLAAGAGGAVVVVFALNAGGGGPPAGGQRSVDDTGADPRPVATFAPQRLPTPISGEAIAPAGGHLLVIGGLNAADASSRQVLRLYRTGPGAGVGGTLRAPVHDAAAATVGGRTLVFGGGSSASTSAIEALSAAKSGGAIKAAPAGRLPAPRSDLASAVVGRRAIVLGGYDGSRLAHDVVATSSGRSLHTVSRLRLPVRYPAVAAIGSTVYVLGGETASGSPTAVIQRIDPASGRSRVVARLPAPTAHASAVAMGGDVYVLGGTARGAASDRIVSFDPETFNARVVGRLPIAVTNAAAGTIGHTGYLVGGIGAGGKPLASVIAVRLGSAARQRPTAPASSSTRPFPGRLLIADRGNNRLLLVNPGKQVLWRYPSRARPAPPGGFYFPDDAFFTHHGHGIISNQEQNETIVQLAFPSGKVTWSYGHPHAPGSAAGYLHEPDDAYLLRDGTVTVADAQNCRLLWIAPDHHVRAQVGGPSGCVHDPPRTLASPNGDTPLANGNVLVSEVSGSWVDELTPSGRLVWSVQLPIAYPSDPQPLGAGRYLVADYSRPGGVYEFDRHGRILWSYHPASGPGMLDHPSLAVRLPNGLIAANDDYRDRVVVIDPRTERIVWQYGRTNQPGTGRNRLNTPDGLDLLARGGSAPLHPSTG
jgi:outer membrane protein assembly factor BamB